MYVCGSCGVSRITQQVCQCCMSGVTVCHTLLGATPAPPHTQIVSLPSIHMTYARSLTLNRLMLTELDSTGVYHVTRTHAGVTTNTSVHASLGTCNQRAIPYLDGGLRDLHMHLKHAGSSVTFPTCLAVDTPYVSISVLAVNDAYARFSFPPCAPPPPCGSHYTPEPSAPVTGRPRYT